LKIRQVETAWEGEKDRPQVIETLVDLTGIEPVTSSLRTMRSPS
jgi:hypothetical protein